MPMNEHSTKLHNGKSAQINFFPRFFYGAQAAPGLRKPLSPTAQSRLIVTSSVSRPPTSSCRYEVTRTCNDVTVVLRLST